MKDWRTCTNDREKYQLYLASREWAVLKEAVRARSKGVCERCHFEVGENVHHQTYERKYQERLDDLVHFCRPCHEYVSGKRGRDPVLDAPVIAYGRKISKVYLAGKITNDLWRDEIFPNWSDWEGSTSPTWMDGAIPDGRDIYCTGPFWVDLEGDIREAHCGAEIATGEHAQGQEKRGSEAASSHRFKVIDSSKDAISDSDMVFAWIDSTDCFGTLVEIGFAVGKGKFVLVGINDFDRSQEMWFPLFIATAIEFAGSAGDAWAQFWKHPHLNMD